MYTGQTKRLWATLIALFGCVLHVADGSQDISSSQDLEAEARMIRLRSKGMTRVTKKLEEVELCLGDKLLSNEQVVSFHVLNACTLVVNEVR